MAKKLAIPDDNREYPEWEYRPFPRWLGRDELGIDLIAHSEAEVEEKTPLVVFPKNLGLNERGHVIQALHPDEERAKMAQVKKPLPEAVGEVAVADTKVRKSK